jgi:hypothetical protein
MRWSGCFSSRRSAALPDMRMSTMPNACAMIRDSLDCRRQGSFRGGSLAQRPTRRSRALRSRGAARSRARAKSVSRLVKARS